MIIILLCVIDTIHFDVIVTVIKHLIIYKTEYVYYWYLINNYSYIIRAASF